MPAHTVLAVARTRDDLDAEILGALSHPLRLSVMRAATDEISPKKLADAFGESVQLVSYHVRILRDAGLLELTRTEPRRGAVEHFYSASSDAATRLDELGNAMTSLAKAVRKPPRSPSRKKR